MRKGFTLLELLVVIGIISILTASGFASYSTAQKKARDAKRKTDLKDIQNAMEQYYSVCGYVYPTPQGGGFTRIFCPTPSMGIMPTAPVDPLNTTPYPCAAGGGPSSACTSTGYTICAAQLEAEPTPAGGYCVTNQQ